MLICLHSRLHFSTGLAGIRDAGVFGFAHNHSNPQRHRKNMQKSGLASARPGSVLGDCPASLAPANIRLRGCSAAWLLNCIGSSHCVPFSDLTPKLSMCCRVVGVRMRFSGGPQQASVKCGMAKRRRAQVPMLPCGKSEQVACTVALSSSSDSSKRRT